MDDIRIIEVKQSVFADNDADAQRLREQLKKEGTVLINMMASPNMAAILQGWKRVGWAKSGWGLTPHTGSHSHGPPLPQTLAVWFFQ